MELEISLFIWSVEYPPEWVDVVPGEVPLLAVQEADAQPVDLQHLQNDPLVLTITKKALTRAFSWLKAPELC